MKKRISPFNIVNHVLAFHLWRPLFYALKAAKIDHFFGNIRRRFEDCSVAFGFFSRKLIDTRHFDTLINELFRLL